jgi:diguanylate cyclase (GGDEF)-like protein
MGRYIHIAIVTVICVAVALLLYLLDTHSSEVNQLSRSVVEEQHEKRRALVELVDAAQKSSLILLSARHEPVTSARKEILLQLDEQKRRFSDFIKTTGDLSLTEQQEKELADLADLVSVTLPRLEKTTTLFNEKKNKQAIALMSQEVLPNHDLIVASASEQLHLIDRETSIQVRQLWRLHDAMQSSIWQLAILLWILLVISLVVGRIRARHRELMLERAIEKQSIELVDANNRIKRLSEMDPLTDLANRRFFEQCLEEDIGQMKRANSPLSLLLIDIDHFKPFNDHYGSGVGDVAIKGIAQVIKKMIPRKTDLVSRYGGQAFMALLPATDAEGAFLLAEKVREKVQELGIKHEYSVIESVVTVSIGVATLEGANLNRQDLIRQADNALRKAKAKGRNRCYVDRQS